MLRLQRPPTSSFSSYSVTARIQFEMLQNNNRRLRRLEKVFFIVGKTSKVLQIKKEDVGYFSCFEMLLSLFLSLSLSLSFFLSFFLSIFLSFYLSISLFSFLLTNLFYKKLLQIQCRCRLLNKWCTY